jgi:signal transduction histidine kinase/streptogramin lyase
MQEPTGAYWFARRGQTARIAANQTVTNDVAVAASIMVADGDGGHWLGTINDGAFYLRPDGDRVNVQHYPLPDERRAYRVRSLLTDADGNIWIGTNASGLLRARRNLFTTYTSAHGLSHDVATAVFVDRAGMVWVGTNCGGVNAIDPVRRTVQIFNPRSPQDPAGDPCIFALTQDGTSMWQGTYGGGVTALPAVPGRPRRAIVGLPDGEVLALFTDRDGIMWVGTRNGGLARVQNGRVRATYTTANGLAHNSIRIIRQTRDGALWIGTIDGLSKLSNGGITNFTASHGLTSTHIRAIHEDAAGTLWVGTYGGGLHRLRNGRLVAITERDGLSGDVVSSILEDDDGNFWMSGNRGIQRVSKRELNAFADGATGRVHSVLYGRGDGLLNPETNGGFQPAAYRDTRGRLWFPTVQGVAVVDPARLQRDTRAPAVVLDAVVVDGVPQPAEPELKVGGRRPNIEFRYAGLSLASPEHLQFRYRLEGYDEDWIDAGRRDVAYYPRLPAGNYRFIVHAANRDGKWNEGSSGFALRVMPAFWQTWWFRLLATLFGAALVLGWWRRRSALAQARHAAQQAFARQLIASQEQERRRLASELHDGLGQELLVAHNRVLLALRADGMNVRVREQLDHVGQLISSSLASVREMSHNLRPHQLEHLGITSALRTMVETAAEAAGIEIDAAIEEIDGLLPADSEINLYRVVQEALSNVVHHAQSPRAVLHIRPDGDVLRVSITDYGRGFQLPRDRRDIGSAGFGLSSMAERARMLGGTLTIESVPDAGTRVELTIPVLPRVPA